GLIAGCRRHSTERNQQEQGDEQSSYCPQHHASLPRIRWFDDVATCPMLNYLFDVTAILLRRDIEREINPDQILVRVVVIQAARLPIIPVVDRSADAA